MSDSAGDGFGDPQALFDFVGKTRDGCDAKACATDGVWTAKRLTPEELRFYIAVNAWERVQSSGVPEVLNDPRFSLSQTIAAFRRLGLGEAAVGLEKFRAVFGLGGEPADVEGRWEAFERACVDKPGLLEEANEDFPSGDRGFYQHMLDFVVANAKAFRDTAPYDRP